MSGLLKALIVIDGLFVVLASIERFGKVNISKIRATYRHLNETKKSLYRVKRQLDKLKGKMPESEL